MTAEKGEARLEGADERAVGDLAAGLRPKRIGLSGWLSRWLSGCLRTSRHRVSAGT